jgi:hypothetical protein
LLGSAVILGGRGGEARLLLASIFVQWSTYKRDTAISNREKNRSHNDRESCRRKAPLDIHSVVTRSSSIPFLITSQNQSKFGPLQTTERSSNKFGSIIQTFYGLLFFQSYYYSTIELLYMYLR